jgi:hypothetical protein
MFEAHRVPADPELMKHLTRAASRSELSVRKEHEGYEAGNQEPPISF